MQHLHTNELNNCYRGNSEIIYLTFIAKYLEWFPSGWKQINRNYWDPPCCLSLSLSEEFLPKKSGWSLSQDLGQPQWSGWWQMT